MQNVYGYVGTSETTSRSSSGGAFMAIAKAFFDEYGEKARALGVVFGEDLNVEYAVAETFDACRAFQGSKYVQSDAIVTIDRVVNLLNEGFAVLFVGTPCVAAGVKKAVAARTLASERLWTVDLICHGTPDKRVWRDYLSWLEKRRGARPVEYSFRYKKVAWRGYPVYVKLSDGKEIVDTYEARTYVRAFLKGATMREACFRCPFKNLDRCGDLTIGDFWGAEAIFDQDEAKRGVSLILENSEKGAAIIERMRRDAEVEGTRLQKIDDDVFMRRQDNLKRALPKPPQYDAFWDAYKKDGFDAAVRRAGFFTWKGRLRARGIWLLKKVGLYSALKK